jgi:hypothetical protein
VSVNDAKISGVAGTASTEPATIRRDSPNRSAEFDSALVDLAMPALLTRTTYQDGHWRAEFREPNSAIWQATEVYRVDGLMQGVMLPAGTWQVRFVYQPWWLTWTLSVAAIGWLSLGGWQCRNLLRARMRARLTYGNPL